MNYIRKLEKDNRDLNACCAEAREQINCFRQLLHSAKFTGIEAGARKDWISTGDVDARLIEIRDALYGLA